MRPVPGRETCGDPFTASGAVAVLSALILAACGGGEPQPRRCELPAESARPLDLTRSADRTHLRLDAEGAENIAIHYADVSPARRKGEKEYAAALDECMQSLFGAVARAHRLDVERVRAYTAVRDGRFDAMVLVSFGALFALAAWAVAGRLVQGIGTDDWRVAALAVIGLSLGAAVVAMMTFDIWATAAENLRLGTSHLSYREERLPWRRHGVLLFSSSVGLFWLIALLRYRRALPHVADGAGKHPESD